MDRWIVVQGQRYGPYSQSQFDSMLRSRRIPQDAQVWLPERGLWVPVLEVLPNPTVSPPLAAPAPTVGGRQALTGTPVGQSPAGPTPSGPSPTGPFDTAGSQAGGYVWTGNEWVWRGAAPTVGAAAATPQYGGQGQPYPGGPGPASADMRPAARGANGLAVAALVVGIVALAICWIPVVNILAVVIGIVGALLAIPALVRARRGAGGTAMAVIGLVISGVAIVASFAIGGAFVQSVDDAIKSTPPTVVTPTAPAPVPTAEAPAPTGPAPETPAAPEVTNSEITVKLGPAERDAFTTTIKAAVTNVQEDRIESGMFEVQAENQKGTVVAHTIATVPTLNPGQSAEVEVVFFEELPSSTKYVVTDIDVLPF